MKRSAVSILLCLALVFSIVYPGFTAFAADITLDITNGDVSVTERLEVQEYRSVQLGYQLSGDAPDGSYVEWESNLPLLAGVDDTGKVTGYDYSKAAVIQLWLDEEVRSMPVVGESMASAIESALASSGIDLETANTDMIVAVVSGISPELGTSLRNMLDNMNVKITATLYSSDGSVLASDEVEVVVTQSVVGNIAPTGVHITNKKSVPKTVAVGTTVQLYGACTPVRLKQGIKWAMGSSALDRDSSNHASVSSSGLVSFTAPGTATVRVNPQNTLYAAFSDTVTFTVVDPSELPVTDFTISGETSVNEGETTQLSIDNLNPPGAYTGDLKWQSDDPLIATVDQHGVVTGLDGGSGLTYSKSVTIKATIGGITKEVTVTVKRSLLGSTISGVEINGLTAVGINNTAAYTASVTPSRLDSNTDVVKKWGIKDPVSDEKRYASPEAEASTDIAKIDNNGKLTGLSSGTATIFVDATYNGTTVTGEYSVLIGNAITDFSISGTATVTEGNTVQLSISGISPDDYDPALLNTVVWKVEDSTVASIDQTGLVKGLDGGSGGLFTTTSRTTTVTATIGGITRQLSLTVQSKRGLNTYTGGEIVGPDAVVVDFPYTYTSNHTPERMGVGRQFWGVESDDGSAPWTSNNRYNGGGNTENSFVSVDEGAGTVSGKQAGRTTLWTYMANNGTPLLTNSSQDVTRTIDVVELTPKSITLTQPSKYEYLEGDSELDLEGLEVKLTYDRDELAKYYPEASGYSEDQLTVSVSDYKVSEINPNSLDSEQYIVVTVTRAGKDMRAIFPILVKSKQVESIEITNPPKYKYLEGVTELDLEGLTVRANYSNAPSEEVTDYSVNTGDFDPEKFNVEQNITVTYAHAGKSASATFPVIVYGIPVVSVSTGDYEGGWTNAPVTFTLSSTNELDGVTYSYKTASDPEWKELKSNSLTVDEDISETYYFKAVNSEGIESAETEGYTVNIDSVVPEFELTAETDEITNSSYDVLIDIKNIGASGVKSISLNGDDDISGKDRFTVDKNGKYTVKVTSESGLSAEKTIEIKNIDKENPEVTSIELEQKNIGGFARLVNELTFGRFFKEAIVATITAEDTGVAGVDKIEYRFLDETGEPIGDWERYNALSKPEQNPNFKGYIEARAIDKATNVSDSLRSDGYVIDADMPTDVLVTASAKDGEYTNGSWTSEDVTLKLSSSAYSGIYKYYYKLNGGDWTEMDSDTLTVTEHGVSNYEFKAVSYSDIESNITEFTVKIDKTVPVIRVDFEGSSGRWTSESVKFSFSLLDDAISGVTYYYSTGDGWNKIESGDQMVIDDNTNASYMFKAVNGAGIESNPSDSYKVMIDKVKPSISFTPAVSAKTTRPYDVGFSVTSGDAGVKSISVNGEDITDKNKITVSENGKYTFVIIGNNGLTSAEVLEINNFIELVLKVESVSFAGKTSGECSNETDGQYGKYFNENAVISITASCNDGNIDKIEYKTVAQDGTESEWKEYNDAQKPEIESQFIGCVQAKATDEFGRTSDIFVSDGITVDASQPTAPQITAVSKGDKYTGEWTNEYVKVSLDSDAFSGIAAYYMSVDGNDFVSVGKEVFLTDEGEHTYKFKAVSNSGTESECSSITAKIETVKPSVFVSVEGTVGKATDKDVVFTLSSNSVSEVEYYYSDGSGWQKLDGNTLTLTENCDAQYSFKAVNKAESESAVSPVYHIIIDKDHPFVHKKPILNVSVNGVVESFTANEVSFTFSTMEAEGEVTYYYSEGSQWQSITGDTFVVDEDGIRTYKFKAVDSMGRESVESAEYRVMLDTAAPEVSARLDNENYTNEAVTAVVEASAGISGISCITVGRQDITAEKQFTVSENGKYTVVVTAGNGLTSSFVLEVGNLDFEAPQISKIDIEHKNGGGFAKFINNITFGLFFNEETEITVEALDNGASGIKEITYQLLDENKEPISGPSVYDENNKPSIDGQFKGYVEAFASDNAGNVSDSIISSGFVLDKDAPSKISVKAVCGGAEYNGEYTAEEITLTPSATAYSGIGSYLYSVDGGEWTVMPGTSLNAEDGEHTYSFKAVSNSNIESGIATVTTKRESGKPVLSVVISGKTDDSTYENVVFTLNATNGNSGMTYYYDDGSGWVEMDGNMLTLSGDMDARYKFKCINGAGSESEESQSYHVIIDKSKVSIEPDYSGVKIADVNTDGRITIADAKLVLQFIVNERPLDKKQQFAADINGDKIVSISDAKRILQIITGLRDPETLEMKGEQS